ncbi:hypothetical protein ABXR30_005200 [Pseudomonas aeruginosa]|jgi:hypothetical protein
MELLQDPFEEAERMIAQVGKWIVGAIETRTFWPTKRQAVSFDGKKFVLMPAEMHEKSTSLPAIAIRANEYGLSDMEARVAIMRFASAIAWRERTKVEVVLWGGGNRPYPMGMLKNAGITHFFDSEFLPAPQDEAACKALAFYREGVSLDNPFYSFLSFYKAFSVAVMPPQTRGEWIAGAIQQMGNRGALQRLAELQGEGEDISNYVFNRGRHAIAHADKGEFVNPDDAQDHYRIFKDLPLMQHLAELAIEERLGVNRLDTILDEHTYELDGFREILPQELTAALKAGRQVQPADGIEVPDDYLVLARKGHCKALLGVMSFYGAGVVDGGFCIQLKSAHRQFALEFFLDFQAERLVFDPLSNVAQLAAARSNREEVSEELSFLLFHKCILLNGHLEVWSADGTKRYGCSEGYMPVNCSVDLEWFAAKEAELNELLQQFPE